MHRTGRALGPGDEEFWLWVAGNGSRVQRRHGEQLKREREGKIDGIEAERWTTEAHGVESQPRSGPRAAKDCESWLPTSDLDFLARCVPLLIADCGHPSRAAVPRSSRPT